MATSKSHDKITLLKLAFKGLGRDELREMAALTEFKTYPSGHTLCVEGAREEIFYIIAEGQASVTKKVTEEGEERLLRTLGKGDMVGEMALIQNETRAATVRAVSELTVLEMEKRDFETILSSNPRMAVDIIRITLDRLRANDQMMISELRNSNKVLRQLDRNKLEFIQVAAHELRTPLTVLNGYVDVMRMLPDVLKNTQLKEMVEGVIKGTDRIREVVNMMLDVSRIDSDSLKAGVVPISIKHVINDIVKGLKQAGGREVEIVAEHPDEPIEFTGDPGLIQKAFYQLLLNAVKYTPDGGRVTITTRRAVMENEAQCIEVRVQDTGIGIDPEHHELIFEKFYQVGSVELHSSGRTTYKGGGPGLGLAIVRGVARAHGGRVWVESAGHDEVKFPGSIFVVQLPIK